MVHTTRDVTDIRTTVVDSDEPVESNGAQPKPSAVPSTHPDPERERELASLLEKAWPKIRASMYYLRDR